MAKLHFVALLTIGLRLLCGCYGVSFTLTEERKTPQLLGRISTQLTNSYRLTPPSDIFWLNDVTGELWANRSVDRDVMENDVIRLFATSSGSVAPINIEVTVLDVNDNDPIFSPGIVRLEIPESTDRGKQYFLSTATDRDGPGNSVSDKYAIVGDSEYFELFIDSSLGQETLLYLRTMTKFNREERDNYLVNISATDDSSQPRVGYLTVNVTILDNNDNTPRFDFSAYTASLYENATAGDEVAVVHATDPDQGKNGLVRYRIDSSSGSTDHFRVDPVSGVVSLTRALDFEDQSIHHLTMEAFDAGQSGQFAQALLTVSVLNVNDNDPEITNLRFFPASATIASVGDDAAIGSTVALITVSDKDHLRPSDGKISLHIVSGNDAGDFRLSTIPNSKTGLLQVAGKIDRREIPSYRLTVRVQDGEFPEEVRSTERDIEIVVNSPNDHFPSFERKFYSVVVSELAPPGSCVLDVAASDLDVGLPARLRYSIRSGNELNWFAIDQQTGLVTTQKRLNYLQTNNGLISLLIAAEDETATPKSATVQLRVTIADENDQWPKFERSVYEVTLNESSPLTKIEVVKATDLDSGVNGTVTYSIDHLTTADGPGFLNARGLAMVDADNGIIDVTSLLIESYKAPYDVIIRASDGADHPLSSTCVVRVQWKNLTTPKPKFYPEIYFLSLAHGSAGSLDLVTVAAKVGGFYDDSVAYRISPSSGVLSINTLSGVVSASGTYSSADSRSFTVTAIDSEGHVADSTAFIHLVIASGPSTVSFDRVSYEFAASESRNSRVALGRVAANDSQLGENELSYSLTSGDPSSIFRVDSTSGELFINNGANLDREIAAKYNLTVTAFTRSQAGVVLRFAKVTVRVFVEDENDNFPRFSGNAIQDVSSGEEGLLRFSDSVEFQMSNPRSKHGAFVYNAEAMDLDTGLNSRLSYKLYDALGNFGIDESGFVTVKKPFESRRFSDIVVIICCDNGAPTLCSEMSLKIEVFAWLGSFIAPPALGASIPADAPANFPISDIALQLLAPEFARPIVASQSDGVATAVSYDVISGDSRLFGVCPDGLVFLRAENDLGRRFERECDLEVNVTLRRRDVTFSKVVPLVVTLTDANDNAPEFPEQLQKFEVSENEAVGTRVGFVQANDLDSGIFSSLLYQIDYNNSSKVPLPFAIDPYSGEISTTAVLDVERIHMIWPEYVSPNSSSFRFQITAQDCQGASAGLKSSGAVEIALRDANEFAPGFGSRTYLAKVREDASAGDPVITVAASDADAVYDVTYTLLTSGTPFLLDSLSGELTVGGNMTLDRELEEFYVLQVEASDRGGKTDSASVEITITDVNNKSPLFKNTPLIWKVPENLPLNTEIGRLEAFDADQPDTQNSLVSFEMTSSNDNVTRASFRVEPASGRVIVTSQLDREAQSSFNIEVIAKDHGSPQRSSHVTVKVTLGDMNDNAPELLPPSQYHVTEGEFASLPRSIGFLKASDSDQGENARVEFKVLEVSPAGIRVSVSGQSGELFVSGSVDREAILPGGMLRVLVRLTDNPDGQNRRSSTSTVYVIVDDVNDSVPAFTSPDTVFVPADKASTVGYDIATISAIDRDSGANGSVSFALGGFQGAGAAPFFLQAGSGVLEVFEAREASAPLVTSVEVTARDEGTPPLFSTMTLNVIPGDPERQSGPRFESSSYSGSIRENLEPGIFVLSVATEANQQISFYIYEITPIPDLGNSPQPRPFAIHPSSGEITSLRRFDREQGVTSYKLRVAAVDMTSSRSEPRVSSTEVEISILDENDNAPLFRSVVSDVIVSESESPGYLVSSLTADDDDQSGGAIVYSLRPGASSEDFEIDPGSGRVTIGARGLDRERTEEYLLTVIASDGVHQSSSQLAVRVLDSNDNDPIFTSSEYIFEFVEGTSTPPSSGVYVGHVSATDRDVGENAEITYSFVDNSDQGHFLIDPKSGEINLNPSRSDNFDRESRDLFVVKVRATDAGGRWSEVRVLINVIDLNDNAPVQISNGGVPLAVEVPANAEVGHLVAEVEATDRDIGFNGIIEYTIVSGDPKRLFAVSMTTGRLTVAKPLEHDSVHHVVIAARDLGPVTSRKHVLIKVTIFVLGEAAKLPQLVLPVQWYVSEYAEKGTPLLRVGSFDGDTNGSQPTSCNSSYSMPYQVPGDAYLDINATTGLMYVARQLASRDLVPRFNVSVAVKCSNGETSQRTITILVSDQNDHAPVIRLSNETVVSIREDAKIGDLLLVVKATDDDTGWNGMTSFKLLPPVSKFFKMDAGTGVIYLARKLDREKLSELTLLVEASDMGVPRHTSNVTIHVTIDDVNDCSPVIEPRGLVLTVNESITTPQKLAKLKVSDLDTESGGVVDFRTPGVTEVKVTGQREQVYDVITMSADGWLTIAPSVDREETRQYDVLITAVDRGSPALTGSTTVLVIVEDTNEFVPVFRPALYRASVAEDAPVGTPVVTVTSQDDDAGEFGIVRYSIDYVDGILLPFTVDMTTGVITTSQPLDREKVTSYNFSVRAQDGFGEENSLFTTTTVEVRIKDANDNFPEFSSDIYSMFTRSDTTNLVGVVFASDADQGDNGLVTYSMHPSFQSLPFNVDVNLGSISATGTLTKSFYNFTVVAQDQGNPPKSREARVNVEVNVGPYPSFVSNPRTVRFQENLLPNTAVLFSAKTSRINAGQMRYFIVGGNINNRFTINSSSGEVRQASALDREEFDTFDLFVEARDSGSPNLSSFTKLQISVSDVNDEAPVFAEDFYVAEVDEDRITNIVTVSAVDSDTGTSDDVVYNLVEDLSESPEKFKLDPTSGNLRNRIKLDREIQETYVLVVEASDQLARHLTTRTTIQVYVGDVNDSPPIFDRLYSTDVSEDASVGDYVIQLMSTDDDSEVNSQARYSLSDSSDDTFKIDAITGLITLNKPLDRENKTVHNLRVDIKDSSWLIHASVTVRVTDANDQAPRFLEKIYKAFVPSGTREGSLILDASATDADEGEYAQVIYTIRNSSDMFAINHTSGEIFATRTLTCNTITGLLTSCPLTFILTLTATDCGNPRQLSSTSLAYVTVKRANQHAPKFGNLLMPIAVLHSSISGDEIFTVTATDDDLNSTITFSLLDPSNSSYFAINPATGAMTLTRPLPARGSKVTVEVRATDNGAPSDFTDQQLVFEVSGPNANAPSFNPKSYTAPALPENSLVGARVFTLTANDPDAGINGMLTYKLTDPDVPFTIDEESGEIRTSDVIDYESVTSYTINVIASDRAVSPRIAYASVLIPISDVNDNPPRFNASSFTAYVSEGASPSEVITRMVATDLDSNSIIQYSANPQRQLVVRALTGDVYLASGMTLDYEKVTSYSTQVGASNGGVVMSTAQLTVQVLGVNEYPPQLTSLNYDVVTSVNSRPGKILMSLNASDQDAGSDGLVSYALCGWSEGEGFKLNSTNGDLTVAEGASLAVGDKFNLTALVKNPGKVTPSLVTQVHIVVAVVTDECSRKPCQHGGTCQDRADSFTCACAAGYTGSLCEREIDDCSPQPCLNGGTCVDLVADFTCRCATGYSGKTCDRDIDHCETQPCKNGGTCVDGLTTYICQCPFGTFGLNCELTSLGFSPLSYLGLPHLDHTENRVSFNFATVSANSLLLYNHGPMTSSAFVALELVEGRMRLSYNFGSGSTHRISAGSNLADGQWHTVVMTTDASSMGVALDGCQTSSSSCSASKSHSGLPEAPLALLGSEELLVGGVANLSDVINHPLQVSSFDFVGCLRHLTVNDVTITSVTSSGVVRNGGVVDGCVRSGQAATGDACVGQDGQMVCGTGSSCNDKWSEVLCSCPSDKSGKTCQNTRVGSRFPKSTFLTYSFLPDYLQADEIQRSGSLFKATSRKRRQASLTDSSIEVRFRTRQSNSMIVMAVAQDASNDLALYLQTGKLTFFQASSGSEATDRTLNDGQWHTVRLLVTSSTSSDVITLTVDGEEVYTDGAWGGVRNFSDPTQISSIYLGGAPTNPHSSLPTTLDGCVFSFLVNGDSQPLADGGGSPFLRVQQAGPASGSDVTMGCAGSDVCAPRPCPSDAFCKDVWEAYQCVPLGDCVSSPCQSGGTCEPSSTAGYTCSCPSNYNGTDCEVYIPCADVNCDLQGENLRCVANTSTQGSTSCVCIPEYVEDSDGRCVAIATGGGAEVEWWIFLIVGIIGVALFIVFICVVRIWRTKKDTATPYPCSQMSSCCHEEDKEQHPASNGNGIAGRNNNGFQTDSKTKTNGVIRSVSLARPDLLPDDVDITDEGTMSPGVQSVRDGESPISSPTSSLANQNVMSNRSLTPLLNDANMAPTPKSNSPLPDYDVIMRQRYASIDKGRGTPPNYGGDREVASEGNTLDAGRFIANKSLQNSPAPSSGHSSDTKSYESGERGRPGSRASLNAREFPLAARTANKSPYGGRTSPMKAMTLLPMARMTSHYPNLSSNREIPLHPRRVSGSAASSSTTSSLSNELSQATSSPTKLPTIEDMVQQLNGLVGLTSEEIELLNGSTRSSRSYSSSGESTSAPSHPPDDQGILPIARNPYIPAERPSSLPGRKIHRVALASRSKTPMMMNFGGYKLSPGVAPRGGDLREIPADLRPSEHLQPPPDTSSDEESDIFNPDRSSSSSSRQRRRSSMFIPDPVEPPIMEEMPEPGSSVHGLNLEFLNTFGRNYEALAGVFQDLAALPSIEDENISEYNTDSTQSSSGSSHVTARTSSRNSNNPASMTSHSERKRSNSRGYKVAPRTRGHSTSALPRMTSPVDVITKRPRSVNSKRTRQEHYV